MSTHHTEGPKHRFRLRGMIQEAERSFLLVPGENRIGGSEDNDLVIPVVGVSRHHAAMVQEGDQTELEDLESRNGTFVNGRAVTKSVIRPGDSVRFGPVELGLEEIDAEDAALGVILKGAADESVQPSPGDQSTAPLTEAPTPTPPGNFGELRFPEGHLPGHSPSMLRFYLAMRPLLTANLPVLIEGETGVGKESVARALHLSSMRRGGPFVPINCAAIPSELLESEIFGIAEGVATGVRKRPGKFRSAEGGTLFLDEIGEMPFELQAKLLRALQEKEIQPVGGNAVPVDVRVVAATNTDLLERVAAERFRRDLYYRVAGVVLQVPALRDRVEDIPLLIEHFLRIHAVETGLSIRGVSIKALRAMVEYPWPGNVRELEHEVRRLAHLCIEGQAIESTMLSPRLLEPDADLVADETRSLRLEDHVHQAERRAISQALELADGSQRKAANLLGISRNTLARKIHQLGIST